MTSLGDFVEGVMADVVSQPGFNPGPVERVSPDMTGDGIRMMLLAAVPPLIDQLRQASPAGRMALLKTWTGQGSSTNIGTFGDQFLYGGKNAGSVFKNIATGLAALSTAPGGVTAFGVHFCASHTPQGRETTKYTRCGACA